MERLQHLISKLNEQNQQKESPLQMLVTLKHIEAELTIMHTAGGAARPNPGVSLVMPSINVGNRLNEQRQLKETKIPVAEKMMTGEPASFPANDFLSQQRPPAETSPQPVWSAPTAPEKKEAAVPVTSATATTEVQHSGLPASQVAPPSNGIYRNGATPMGLQHTSPAAEALKKYQPQPAEPARNREPAATAPEPPAPQIWSVDPLMEVPTLSHQPGAPELNDIIGMRNPSINDRLKDNGMKEAGYQLKGAPVKELRKAIGVNDRYLFINELFRGDEAMYERSIKTINNFRILPEAQYWMERELKIKIGWDDSRDIVQHFYELVSRRFS